jgi:hypothetical protein
VLKDGFFELQTPRDLLRKLKHDRERMNANPGDSFAAFDFVVTALHLHDWARQTGAVEKGQRPQDPRQRLAWELCGDVANGAKHFVMRDRRPMGHTVAGSLLRDPEHGAANYGSDLVIALTKAEPAIDGRGARFYDQDGMTIKELADLMLAYWGTVLAAPD